MIAELTWDNTNKLLKIRGTIYIDGGLTQSQDATYQGVNSSGVHPSGDLTGNDGIGGQAVHLRVRVVHSIENSACAGGTQLMTRPP